MNKSVLLPIDRLEEHDVRGERRWTGRVALSSGYSSEILILQLRSGLLAVRNRCPHRDVALLLGRFDEDARILECPSHGLELSLDGHDLRAMPVIEQDGKFFMLPGEKA
jgi:nitrite reductase/ring-hydroxylating ferredoxin subunit